MAMIFTIIRPIMNLYTIERIDGELVVVVMAGTRENFYDELKRYIKR